MDPTFLTLTKRFAFVHIVCFSGLEEEEKDQRRNIDRFR